MKDNRKNISLRKRLALAGSCLVLCSALSGCMQTELAPDVSYLDVLDTNDEQSGKSLSRGVTQKVDINGEKFKLLISYLSGEEKWSINANKKLFMEIKTEGLPENLEVYIDNIHVDTTIVSTKAAFDGIKQDSMDDRIHNSQMLGFPISDTQSYFGINEIEGQNETFIQGYIYGNRYYTSGEITEKRFLESDYLEDGVWANKIDSVIDLIIVDKTTNEVLRVVSVPSSLIVKINNQITFYDGGEYKTYEYDKNGQRRLVRTQNSN